MESNRPGKELPKEYRTIVDHLVVNQGWRYNNTRKGHPMLYPTDRTKTAFPVPTTPGDNRSLKNFKAQVRRSGGHLPN